MLLKNKKIILGITGSIAAYKAAFLTRLLVKEGAQVKIILTPYAKEFITPVTLATLSKNTVLCDFFHHDDGAWNSHVELGLWADLFLIAPATANTMAKMANGVCDNLLLTTYLSVRCPVMIAPAMDCDMFQHPATLKNMQTLKSFGNIFVEPASGELASGLMGKGRMEEPEIIVKRVADFFSKSDKLKGKTFLVTAGPTYEHIDPVRFVGNHSSGKMGFAIAEKLAENGAKVILVSGPTVLKTNNSAILLNKVTTAQEMYEACINYFPKTDGAIMAAAVADYKPTMVKPRKIKKSEQTYSIKLEPTIDIAASLGKIKKKNQLFAGFALETNDELSNARKKLKSKNFDFIVLNSLKDEGAGFNTDTNKITIIDKHNKTENFKLKSKADVANDIVAKIISFLSK